jgi:hypothetical protein
MRTSATATGLLALALAMAACDTDVQAPGPTSVDGVDLAFDHQTYGSHAASGNVAASGSPLASEFAVAVNDSLGGLVVLSYDADSRGLFILQTATRATGTYTCLGVETGGPPCHGRYLHNVRVEDGLMRVDAHLELSSGTLVLKQVGGGVLRGTLDARLDPVAGEDSDPLIITDGVLDVRYIAEELEDGRLHCLIGLTGGGVGWWGVRGGRGRVELDGCGRANVAYYHPPPDRRNLHSTDVAAARAGQDALRLLGRAVDARVPSTAEKGG